MESVCLIAYLVVPFNSHFQPVDHKKRIWYLRPWCNTRIGFLRSMKTALNLCQRFGEHLFATPCSFPQRYLSRLLTDWKTKITLEVDAVFSILPFYRPLCLTLAQRSTCGQAIKSPRRYELQELSWCNSSTPNLTIIQCVVRVLSILWMVGNDSNRTQIP